MGCLFPKMDYRYILIAVSVVTSVSSSYGSQDQVITTSFGKNATLPCQIANLDSDLQFLHWAKDGKIIYSRTSKGEHTSGKNLVIDAASLVIPDAMESDAGNYSCVVGRKSFATEESDIMQLYVIDVTVSHCQDTGQDVDGCSCNIYGSTITSLQCSASGFPHPPVVTWEEDTVIYQSSSVDLTRFSENITLTCKARDENLKGAVANKTACVYYAREVMSACGSPVEITTASVNDQARVAAIVLSIVLILVLLIWPISCLAVAYRRKKGKAFRLLPTLLWTSKPKRIPGNFGVMKDSWKNSRESSVGDLPTSQPMSTSIEGGIDDADYSPKECNQEVLMSDEQPFPLVGLVLLDDLRSAPEETKECIKAAVVALVEKRIEPYKIRQSHVDPIVTIHTSFIDMNATLQRSMKTEHLGDPDAAFVDMVLQDLDEILDERDRDECEILITKPDFQEVENESQLPGYQGSRVINQSLHMPSNMTSSMTRSMVACKSLSTVLREELVKKPSERAAIRNAISQIILDFLKTGHSGLKCTSVSSYADEVVDDNVSRLVAFWTSKTVKLDNDVNNRIKKCLFPLKPRNINKSSDLHPVGKTRQEEDEIPDTPSTAKLLEDKCRDSEESNNYQSST